MGRIVEIESVAALEQRIAEHGDLAGCVIQGLDLRDVTIEFAEAARGDTVFLGCRFAPDPTVALIEAGVTVLPDLGKQRPYHPTRSRLYSLEELMQGFDRQRPGSFTTDARDSLIYGHFSRFRYSGEPLPIMEALAQRLHDHAIDDALHDLLYASGKHRAVVAVMGGHAMKRSDAAYRRVARITQALAGQGYLIATGGGPGAMEAGNLGAWFCRYERVELEAAIDMLVEEVDYHEHHYLELGYRVRERFPGGGESLAIPTWFYGHEPSNQFSTHIAKYFSNSLREDGLLAIATHGVIYAPGSAGTVQEIFMDATQNHYGVFEWTSPMVLFGTEYWTRTKPVRPLLDALSEGRPYAELITCSDSVDEVVEFIREHPPIPSKK